MEKEKNFYVNQLNNDDINDLFNLLKLYINLNGKKVPIDYAIQTPNCRFKIENSKPYTTLFLRDFTCYVSNADVQTKNNIKEVYRAFMSKIFEGTTYDEEAILYDNRVAERNAKKSENI